MKVARGCRLAASQARGAVPGIRLRCPTDASQSHRRWPLHPSLSAFPNSPITPLSIRAVAQAILQQLDRPLLCSTAGSPEDDHAGGLAPDAAVLMDRYGPAGLDFVVDGGPRLAEGSTVVDCTGVEPVVVRRGKGDPALLGLEA